MCTHSQTYRHIEDMPFMGWSHLMMRPFEHFWLFQSQKLWKANSGNWDHSSGKRTYRWSATSTYCQNERVFHTMSCLRFKMATNVTFVLYHVYYSVCSHGVILPDETPTSCCSFVCAFDLSAQLQRRLSFTNDSKHWKHTLLYGIFN